MAEAINKVRPEAETAKILGISESTLARLRKQGVGPKVTRLSARRYGYSDADREAWVAKGGIMANEKPAEPVREQIEGMFPARRRSGPDRPRNSAPRPVPSPTLAPAPKPVPPALPTITAPPTQPVEQLPQSFVGEQ